MRYETEISLYPADQALKHIPAVFTLDPTYIDRDPAIGVMFGYTEATNITLHSVTIGGLTLDNTQLVAMCGRREISDIEDAIGDQIEREFASGDLEAA